MFEVSRNKEMSKQPRVGLAFGDWLTGYTAFPVRRSIVKDTKLSKFQFADLAPWAGAAASWT